MVFPCTEEDVEIQSRRPFNVSSRRFSCPTAGVNTNPGPGNYTANSRKNWQHGSLGQKGYGPFVSSSTRLSNKIHYTGPGPASYSPKGPPSKHASTAPWSAVFHTAGHANSNSSSSSATPPPGAYGVPGVTHQGGAVDWCSSRKPGATAAFKATSREAAPAPGSPASHTSTSWLQHSTADGVSNKGLASLVSARQGGVGPDSRTSVERRSYRKQQPGSSRQQVAASASAAAAAAATANVRLALSSAQLANRISAAVFGEQGRSRSAPPRGAAAAARPVFDATAEVPGVGSYEVGAAGSISNNLQHELAAGRCSPMFAQPLVITGRLGVSTLQQPQTQQHVPVQQEQPGGRRGWSQQQLRHFSAASSSPGVGAPFRSKSPGHSEALLVVRDDGAPGPAYYQAHSPPSKVSYRHPTSSQAAAIYGNIAMA